MAACGWGPATGSAAVTLPFSSKICQASLRRWAPRLHLHARAVLVFGGRRRRCRCTGQNVEGGASHCVRCAQEGQPGDARSPRRALDSQRAQLAPDRSFEVLVHGGELRRGTAGTFSRSCCFVGGSDGPGLCGDVRDLGDDLARDQDRVARPAAYHGRRHPLRRRRALPVGAGALRARTARRGAAVAHDPRFGHDALRRELRADVLRRDRARVGARRGAVRHAAVLRVRVRRAAAGRARRHHDDRGRAARARRRRGDLHRFGHARLAALRLRDARLRRRSPRSRTSSSRSSRRAIRFSRCRPRC